MTREEAITKINEYFYGGGYQFSCWECAGNCKTCELGIAFDLAIEALKEPKKGKWIKKHNLTLGTCSICGEEGFEGNYCMWCGARMRGIDIVEGSDKK